MYGSYLNKRIKVFNLDEKIQSIFFLNSPNIITIKVIQ